MQLSELGLDRWFADQAREQCGSDLSVARVTAVDRGRYLVRDEHGERPAELTGRLQFAAESSIDLPCVGDWVCVRCLDARSHASIHGVLPRKSFLRRKVPGKDIDFQMIAANIDVAFVIQACHFDFNVRRLERYLVMVREGHVEPVLLLTKTDLVDAGELDSLIGQIRAAGIDVGDRHPQQRDGRGPGSGSRAADSRQDVLPARFVGRREDDADQPLVRRLCDWRRETSASRGRDVTRPRVVSWSCSRVALC